MSGQNVTYAGFKSRFIAFVLDYLLIAAYILALLAFDLVLGSGPPKGVYQILFSNSTNSEISAFFLLTLPVVLYFALSETSRNRATWGKKKMRIQVVRYAASADEARRISLGRSLLRSGLKFLPWELTHYLLWQIPGWPFDMNGAAPSVAVDFGFGLVYALVLLYFVSVIVGKAHRSVYDRVAGTAVIS